MLLVRVMCVSRRSLIAWAGAAFGGVFLVKCGNTLMWMGFRVTCVWADVAAWERMQFSVGISGWGAISLVCLLLVRVMCVSRRSVVTSVRLQFLSGYV